MIPGDLQLDTPALEPCSDSSTGPESAEIVWMLRRAERRLTEIFNEECRAVGLRDVRDTLVLGVARQADRQSQTEMTKTLGIDKSTLGLILDRLESHGWLVREAHPENRKLRIPRTTPEGSAKLDEANIRGRDTVRRALDGLPQDEMAAFRSTLWQVARIPRADAVPE